MSGGPSVGILEGRSGVGGTFGVAVPLEDNVHVGIASGYYRWNDGALRAIPLLGTLTYYFDGGRLHPFFGLAAGAVFVTETGRGTQVSLQAEVRPGIGFELGGTFLYIENHVGILRGELLVAPTLGISVPF